jgi:thioredoxin reductase
MEFIKLPERQVPVFARTQLIVVGGGVAGLAAAISAVRQGCKTILIDEGGILGGTVTKCIMPSFGSLISL